MNETATEIPTVFDYWETKTRPATIEPVEKALLVGYGRAGSRHLRIMEEMGVKVAIVEPDHAKSPRNLWLIPTLEKALQFQWDAAVIATPPDLHLEQVETCLAAGVPRVMVEKPLCDLGQLKRANLLPGDGRLFVAYNYRWHPEVRDKKFRRMRDGFVWRLECAQQRDPWPEWGFLLDHLSHDLQILEMVAGPLEVERAKVRRNDTRVVWEVWGSARAGSRFAIRELVTRNPVPRSARLRTPKRVVNLWESQEMHRVMWREFATGGDWCVQSLEEALIIQHHLERINELCQN